MDAQPVLLDTDILSAIMRSDSRATAEARRYLNVQGRFSFSVITRYEVLRGLLAKGATQQSAAFERLCSASEVLPVTDAIAHRAARIYADLRNQGRLIGDADILIGATALVHGYAVASNNAAHLARIHGLPVENWLR